MLNLFNFFSERHDKLDQVREGKIGGEKLNYNFIFIYLLLTNYL